MKTAITIPDALFRAAEDVARKLGVTRRELYSQAVRDYTEMHGREDLTERLNLVYLDENSTLDETVDELQARSLSQDDWG